MGLLLVTSACTYLKEVIGLGPVHPKVKVTEITVVQASLSAIDLLVSIHVDNPNGFDLEFSKLQYQMMAGSLAIAKGMYAQTVNIPEDGQAEIKLPLTIDARNAFKLLNDILSKQEDTFAVWTATAEFSTPFGAMDVDFEDRRPLRKFVNF